MTNTPASFRDRLPRLVAEQPVLLSTAIRVTILCAVAFGFALDEAQIVAIMVAVEAWLAVFQFLLVTPEVKVTERVIEATAVERQSVLDSIRALDEASAEVPETLLGTGAIADDPPRLNPRPGPR